MFLIYEFGDKNAYLYTDAACGITFICRSNGNPDDAWQAESTT
jgi:hypothetical protein